MVATAQRTEPSSRWLARHRAHGDRAVAQRLGDGVQIRRRNDHQLAACSRLLGLVSAESGYPLPRPGARLGWLTGPDVLNAWIAEQHGRVHGHVAIARVDSDPGTSMRWREVTGRHPSELADVSRFFVRSDVRRRGLGTALLGTAVEACRAQALTPVAMMVSTSKGGVPFFDRQGWRMVAMYPCGGAGDGLETYLYVAPPTRART